MSFSPEIAIRKNAFSISMTAIFLNSKNIWQRQLHFSIRYATIIHNRMLYRIYNILLICHINDTRCYNVKLHHKLALLNINKCFHQYISQISIIILSLCLQSRNNNSKYDILTNIKQKINIIDFEVLNLQRAHSPYHPKLDLNQQSADHKTRSLTIAPTGTIASKCFQNICLVL